MSHFRGHISTGQRQDLELFRRVLLEVRPEIAVELGTGHCGIGFFFAETMAELGGEFWTFDIDMRFGAEIRDLQKLPNVRFFNEDIRKPNDRVLGAIKAPKSYLFCDNGHKETEIALYAPWMGPGSVLSCHDYGPEVRPEWAEPFLSSLGYTPLYSEEAAKLDGNAEYGTARFWKRQ